jgi:hypothetical protein
MMMMCMLCVCTAVAQTSMSKSAVPARMWCTGCALRKRTQVTTVSGSLRATSPCTVKTVSASAECHKSCWECSLYI